MSPNLVILDTEMAMMNLRMAIGSIERFDGWCDCGNCLPSSILEGVVEALADRDTAEGALEDYVIDIHNLYSIDLEQEDLDCLKKAVAHLGRVILQELIKFKVYDSSGGLWYEPECLINDNVLVLKKKSH